MKCYKYFRMKIDLFPQDIIDQYNLTNKVDHNGNIHCEVRCSMYDLSQAEIIAQELLDISHLERYHTNIVLAHPTKIRC